MEKYIITGFSGFVSKHFLEYIDTLDVESSVYGLDVNQPDFNFQDFKHVKCQFRQIDLLDKAQVDNIIYQFQPNFILHLASYSSVAFSWKNPVESFANNTNIFLNLLEQLRKLNLNCRVLSIGSSEEYGNVVPEDVPLIETHTLKPVSPYAVARVSQEMLSKVFVDGYGLDIVITRSFNHIGPGQRDVFVVSSFAKQCVEIKKGKKKPEITTGNLSIVRDFLDVRDVVKAYYLLFKHGQKGEVYNVCSGNGITLENVLDKLIKIQEVPIEKKIDTSLIRPSDNSIIIGNNQKLQDVTGWQPEISLDKSLADILNYWSALV
jgi:GDP-4-dehydro-6-deoxy-D-mannose reductase